MKMSELLTLSLLFSTIRFATPLIFAALGGMFSERAGVINVALEGLMLAGAFTGAVATYQLSDPSLGLPVKLVPFLGLLCGMLAGAFLVFVYAIATIKFEA